MQAIKRIPRSRRKRYDTSSFKYYMFDVSYNNCPDVFTYYFKAKNMREVAKATGIDAEFISECGENDIRRAITLGKHIDIVINGRLIEQD